jgi:hypothetical protein
MDKTTLLEIPAVLYVGFVHFLIFEKRLFTLLKVLEVLTLRRSNYCIK